jgi:hypothetical protein
VALAQFKELHEIRNDRIASSVVPTAASISFVMTGPFGKTPPSGYPAGSPFVTSLLVRRRRALAYPYVACT